MYQDTSGSISIQEANDHLAIVDDFLRAGSRKCDLSLWHTEVYYSEKYKLGDRIKRDDFQSGGTDLEPVLQHIADAQPDLAIIYTDGCYWDVEYERMTKFGVPFPQVLFIISKDGNADHPLRRLGETVKIPNTQYTLNDKALED
jgi:predicted metal-dependent peptidase